MPPPPSASAPPVPELFVRHLPLPATRLLRLPLLKRGVDIMLASLGLVLAAPLLLAVFIAVRRDGGPAFFRQPRLGRNSRLFNCYKFRTMRTDAEAVLARHLSQNPEAAAEWTEFQKLKEDVRITPFGRFIRRASIDELPQLINVLKGEMSLVGPRPCLPGQQHYYAEDFRFYESVRPGLTGLWQVCGRNSLTFKERVVLEAWYARNWSLWLDTVILLRTIPALLKRGQAF